MRTWLTLDGIYVSEKPEEFVIGITIDGKYITNKTRYCHIRTVYRDGTRGAWRKYVMYNHHTKYDWAWADLCAILSKWYIEAKLHE